MTLNTISDLTPPPAEPATAGPAPEAAPAPAFLTARQLAAALGISRRTLTNWNQRQIIPSVCVGRVRRYELEQVREALRAHSSGSASCSASSGHSTETGTTATY